MRSLVCALVAVAVGTVACGEPTSTTLQRELEQFTARLASDGEFSGVVSLTRHGEPVFRQAFGNADRARGRANTVDTPFALASVSKMFTAVAILQLVEQRALALDDTIGSLLPDYPEGPARSQVTVQHLLTMSSGVRDLFRVPEFWAGIERIKTAPDFWPFFATAPLTFQPGSRWEYSNSNFLILGAMVERVTGRPFADVIDERVFRPAGMTATGYRSSHLPAMARGYTRTRPDGVPAAADGWYPAWEEGGEDFAAGAPMGGGISTAGDLTRFARALMEGRLLTPAMVEQAITGRVAADSGGHDGYGFETRTVGGIRAAGHRGSFAGTANQVEFYPDLGYVLVVLGNTDAAGTEAIANHARDQVLRLESAR